MAQHDFPAAKARNEERDRVLAVLAEHFKSEGSLEAAALEAFERIKRSSRDNQPCYLSADHNRALDFIFRSQAKY